MNLRRCLSFILMMGLILALNPLSVQADPYHHPHGRAYGWHGPKHHGFDRYYKHFRRSCKGTHNPYYVDRFYGEPPSVTYVTPVAPVMGIPYAPQPQPYYYQPSQPAMPGFHGQFNYNF